MPGTIYEKYPWLRSAWSTGADRLVANLSAVPPGAIVLVVLAYPDNKGGKFNGKVWNARRGDDVETARQEITDMARRFLDEVLPFPE